MTVLDACNNMTVSEQYILRLGMALLVATPVLAVCASLWAGRTQRRSR